MEVYGIGIHTDAPKMFYPEYSVITERMDIAQAIFGCLQKKIMNGFYEGK
jgi:hypothetical protein